MAFQITTSVIKLNKTKFHADMYELMIVSEYMALDSMYNYSYTIKYNCRFFVFFRLRLYEVIMKIINNLNPNQPIQ